MCVLAVAGGVWVTAMGALAVVLCRAAKVDPLPPDAETIERATTESGCGLSSHGYGLSPQAQETLNRIRAERSGT